MMSGRELKLNKGRRAWEAVGVFCQLRFYALPGMAYSIDTCVSLRLINQMTQSQIPQILGGETSFTEIM
jgi:hypothetical protein